MSADAAALRRLTWLVGAAVLLDTTFYAVVAPLLPALSHSLHLSKLGSGLLTASYAAGMLVASFPAGLLAVRRGPRVAVRFGLALMVVSTVAFAFLSSAPALDLARFSEGIGGASSWSGGIAWLIAASAPTHRGRVIGRALSAAIAGAVLGPAVGALASALGRPVLFCTLAAGGLAVMAAIRTLPVPAPQEPASSGEVRRPSAPAALAALLGPASGPAALWLMALPAIVSGTLTVLGPLALHPLGAGAGVIGLTFIGAAAAETALSTWVGGVTDRHGRLAPLAGALLASGLTLACFSAVHSVPLLIAVIAATATATGAAWTPAMTLLSDLSEQAGLDQALGAGLMNVAWAAGQIIGSGGSGALARLTGNAFTTRLVAGLCLCTALTLLARRAPRGLGGQWLSAPGRGYRRNAPPGPGPVPRSSRTRG